MDDQGPVFTYSVDDGDQRFDVPPTATYWSHHWVSGASELAADYFYNHDGWESTWPLIFSVYEDEQRVARFQIEMEMEPVFRGQHLFMEAPRP